MDNHSIIEIANRVFLANYRPAPIVLESGKGCRVTDVEGRTYLDLCAGIAVVAVGHAHPVLVKAIAEQAGQLMHVSNLFYNRPAVQLAAELSERTAYDRFYFCNSGAEAVESLLKLARRYHFERGDTARTGLVSMQHSFHGRSMGALSLTGQSKYHEGMGPMVGGIEHVPFGDIDALRAVVGSQTAAVLLEPIQGEGGIVVGEPSYFAAVRALCDEAGALLMFDEVQTGIGRTGTFLAQEWSGVQPDACALAKGIGGGFPLGAIGVVETLVDALPPGTHATTYGGNPLACAAALAVLKVFDDEDLIEHVVRVGDYLGGRLAALADDDTVIHASAARGRGLLQGIVLAQDTDPASVLAAIRQRGVLLTLAGGNVLRFSPPLVVTQAELDEGLAVVKDVLSMERIQ